MKSMKLLSRNAGLETAFAERLCEPSSKYTLQHSSSIPEIDFKDNYQIYQKTL